MSQSNRREYYRIPYSMQTRPRFVMGSAICEVLNCSETGVLFQMPNAVDTAMGAEIEGRIRLQCGADLRVRGPVLRREDELVALQFAGEGIPFGLVLKEQLYLRALARGAVRQPTMP